MELSQLCAANYHYKRYTLDYFLESAERLGYQSIELWASGPHLHLEDFDAARLAELNRKIKAHHLALRCFTPEQCVYAISVSHPDKVYRDRTVDFSAGTSKRPCSWTATTWWYPPALPIWMWMQRMRLAGVQRQWDALPARQSRRA